MPLLYRGRSYTTTSMHRLADRVLQHNQQRPPCQGLVLVPQLMQQTTKNCHKKKALRMLTQMRMWDLAPLEK